MLLVYVEEITNRVRYTFELLLGQLGGVSYMLTSDADSFTHSASPKLSYADAPLSNELFFKKTTILFEQTIVDQNIYVIEYGKLQGLFATDDKSAFPFDPFGTAFYMVTRYEEYLHYQSDIHDRYKASDSLAGKKDFLARPVVNDYAIEIQKMLEAKYPELGFRSTSFEFLPSFDVDMAYCYANKGIWRNAVGFLNDIYRFRFSKVSERFKVVTKKEKDPFDVFDYLTAIHKRYKVAPIYFFLLGRHSKYNKNISDKNPEFVKLIKKISSNNLTGIHFSYGTSRSKSKMKSEIYKLANIVGKKVYRNRFHYLKFKLPDSYQKLLEAGVTEEYTMGHASQAGFRAGICSPFYFFDLTKNDQTDLRVFPFAYMDVTLKNYLRLTPDEAVQKIKELMQIVFEVKGTFIPIWHNSNLHNTGEWKGWRAVYEQQLDIAQGFLNRANQ